MRAGVNDAAAAFGVGLLNDEGSQGLPFPVAAAAYRGTGKLHALVNGGPEWTETVQVCSLCVRRLRQRLGLQDVWASDMDLYVGAWQAE